MLQQHNSIKRYDTQVTQVPHHLPMVRFYSLPDNLLTVIHKDVLSLALDWQRIGQRIFTLWYTASLYCHYVTSG